MASYSGGCNFIYWNHIHIPPSTYTKAYLDSIHSLNLWHTGIASKISAWIFWPKKLFSRALKKQTICMISKPCWCWRQLSLLHEPILEACCHLVVQWIFKHTAENQDVVLRHWNQVREKIQKVMEGRCLFPFSKSPQSLFPFLLPSLLPPSSQPIFNCSCLCFPSFLSLAASP